MGIGEQVRALLMKEPFRAFNIKTANGRTFLIQLPVGVTCSVDGREITIYDDEGKHSVNATQIESIERVEDSGVAAGEPA